MAYLIKLADIDLQLFADGGAAGGDGAGTGDNGASQGSMGAQYSTADGSSPEQNDTQSEADARQAEYDAFIAKYKDLDDARIQKTVKSRLAKSSKELNYLRHQNARQNDIISIVGHKYGKDASDMDGIYAAVAGDDVYYEDEALETGKTVAEVRAKHENDALRAQIEDMNRKERLAEISESLRAEVEQTKEMYPDFDFDTEYADPQFKRLVQNGVQLETAYYVCHRDDIDRARAKNISDRSRSEIAKSIAAGKALPHENGGRQPSAVPAKTNIHSMTHEQIMQVYRDAQDGKRPTFG